MGTTPSGLAHCLRALGVSIFGAFLLSCVEAVNDPAATGTPKDTVVVTPITPITPITPKDTTKPPVTKPDTAKPPITGLPVDTAKPPKPDTVKPDTTKPVTPSCSGSDWQAGKQYEPGAIVRYPADGKWYKCVKANPGYDPVVSTWFWSLHDCSGGTPVDTVKPPRPDTVKPPKPDTVKPDTSKPVSGLASVFTEAMFDQFFGRRNSFYTYKGLLEAVSSYPAFGNTGDAVTRKREVAAFLANVTHETGSLVYVEEIAKGEYCGHDWSGRCACQPGKKYYGRGPLQLSWNYNYGGAGAALNLPLCQDPDLVARDPKVAWQVALWFWMTNSGAGSQTCHAGITGSAGFGATIQTINGGLECGGRNPGAVTLRVNYYKALCKMIGVDPGTNTGC